MRTKMRVILPQIITSYVPNTIQLENKGQGGMGNSILVSTGRAS